MYFVVYDEKDNIIAYLDSIDELIEYFNYVTPKKIVKHRWKNKKVHYVQFKNQYYIVHKFI